MKSFIACLGTETNTFSPIPTGLETFAETMLCHGDATARDFSLFAGPLHVWRERTEAHQGQVVVRASVLDPASVRTQVRDIRREAADGVRLESADVVVAGGGGMQGPKAFDLARELAGLWGGAVGASRVACDLGWCPPSYQIGLTGRTVAPELYIAVGISGAGQHMAGCAGAKAIVAVNSDADAAIFARARFGVVGDAGSVVPALIEEIRKLKE